MVSVLLILALGCLLWTLLVAEHRRLCGLLDQADFERWRQGRFALAEESDHQRLWRVRFWGANGVVMDAFWYSERGGARSSAVRSARPGVPRGQPSAPRLLRCCRHVRRRRLP